MDRVESALAWTPPLDAVLELAGELRDGGMPQAELLAPFDAARERHGGDADETSYDAILDDGPHHRVVRPVPEALPRSRTAGLT